MLLVWLMAAAMKSIPTVPRCSSNCICWFHLTTFWKWICQERLLPRNLSFMLSLYTIADCRPKQLIAQLDSSRIGPKIALRHSHWQSAASTIRARFRSRASRESTPCSVRLGLSLLQSSGDCILPDPDSHDTHKLFADGNSITTGLLALGSERRKLGTWFSVGTVVGRGRLYDVKYMGFFRWRAMHLAS